MRRAKKNEQIAELLGSAPVYLIKEQRLIKQARFSIPQIDVRDNVFSVSNTIEEYARELRNKIMQKQQEAGQLSQQLANTFAVRLIASKNVLLEKDFDARFQILTKKQQQLQKFKISTGILEKIEYTGENQRILSVSIEDSEKVTAIFEDLLIKLNLFEKLLSEKQFTSKFVGFDDKKGFCFTTSKGEVLKYIDLSAGEQQEFILLYEILFNTHFNTLVLIDEPEISLHVAWQHDFVKDLQEIAQVQRISFILATHSPQIISGRWDLTHDLYADIHGEYSAE